MPNYSILTAQPPSSLCWLLPCLDDDAVDELQKDLSSKALGAVVYNAGGRKPVGQLVTVTLNDSTRSKDDGPFKNITNAKESVMGSFWAAYMWLCHNVIPVCNALKCPPNVVYERLSTDSEALQAKITPSLIGAFGPSLGGTCLVALTSHVTRCQVRGGIGVTAALRLDGFLEPVGGIETKEAAFKEGKLHQFICSSTNKAQCLDDDEQMTITACDMALDLVKMALIPNKVGGKTKKAKTAPTAVPGELPKITIRDIRLCVFDDGCWALDTTVDVSQGLTLHSGPGTVHARR